MGEVVPISEADEQYARSRVRRGRDEKSENRESGKSENGRSLPHSLEAEEYLLSCLMLPESGADTLAGCLRSVIRPESFYDTKHGVIYRTILRLFAASRPIVIEVVAEELKTAGDLDQIGGYAFLTQVSARIPTSAQASYFIERVRSLSLLREIIRTTTGLAEDAYGAQDGVDAFAGAVSQRILALTSDQSGLPSVVSDEALEVSVLPEAEMLIEGVMHRGRRTLLLAPSKASKTWTAMNISLAIASGRPWMGFRTHKCAVLHIDLELPTWDLKKRRTKLREIMEIPAGERLAIEWWSLDGYQRSIDELLPLITARAPLGKFGLIVIEPAYVIMGKRDENDNADVTDFMNRLAWLARMTGAAVLCTHHFAKGDASKKEAKDRGSGAGAWVRAPDTAITLTPLNEDQGDDCYVMEFVERSMKRASPVGVQFEYPVFRCKNGLDLNALREPGRPKETTEKDVVRILGGETWTHGEWMKACEKTGLSERTFNRRVKEAIEADLVVKNGPIYKRAAA